MTHLTPEEQARLAAALQMAPTLPDIQWMETATWLHCELCRQMYSAFNMSGKEGTDGGAKQDDPPGLAT